MLLTGKIGIHHNRAPSDTKRPANHNGTVYEQETEDNLGPYITVAKFQLLLLIVVLRLSDCVQSSAPCLLITLQTFARS